MNTPLEINNFLQIMPDLSISHTPCCYGEYVLHRDLGQKDSVGVYLKTEWDVYIYLKRELSVREFPTGSV